MHRVRFTANLQRHVSCPERECAGTTVREAIDDYFAHHPDARGYVLDDRGAMRAHMLAFVDGRPVADRTALSDPLPDRATIDVMQALSGG